MPRNGSGSYSLPTGNPVVTGTTIEASWANNTLSDIGNELTNSLSRTGAGGMTGAFRAADGSSTLPGIAWGSETATGFYRAGTSDMRAVVATGLIQKWTAAGSDFVADLSVATNKFTVASASGNTVVAGTFAVAGNAAFDTNTLYVNATDNTVSIGTTTVLTGEKLDVNGGVKAQSFNAVGTPAAFASAGGLSLAYNGGGAAIVRAYSNGSGAAGELLLSSTGGLTDVVLNASGNFGIGVASPAAKFDLGGDYREKVNTANTGTAYTINLSDGTIQILTLTGNCTFTFPTATAGKSFMILLKQDGTGSRTVTWPASVKWPSAAAPTVTSTASKLDKFVFTADGTNWYGSNAGQNYTV